MKKLLSMTLTLALILQIFTVNSIVTADAKVPTKEEIKGVWYLQYEDEGTQEYWSPEIFEILENGKFYRYDPLEKKSYIEEEKKQCDTYTYDETKGKLIFSFKDFQGNPNDEKQKWRFEKSAIEGIYKVYYDDEKKPTFLASKDYKLLGSQFKSYKKSVPYLKEKVDKNGFYIKNGVLKRYLGNKKTVKIPKKVKAIAAGAFERVPGYNNPKTKKIIVPGTCKTIKKEAFIFSGIKNIVLKEGVKTLGKRCFADTYWKKVYLPKSLKKIGSQILATEEGLTKTKIYVYRGSKADKYFKKNKNKPYGKYKIKYRK